MAAENREYKLSAERRAYERDQKRIQRARKKKKAMQLSPLDLGGVHPVDALAEWAEITLKVPAGKHPLAGGPMALPAFVKDFLKDTWYAPEKILCTARKNGKTSIAATLALAFLDGPLSQPGLELAVASTDRAKAKHLLSQIRKISEASGLEVETLRGGEARGLRTGATLTCLAADGIAADGFEFDGVIVDETGLLPERRRDYLASIRTSVSTRKDSWILHISIRGDSPLLAEALDNPEIPHRIYAADDDADLEDVEQWKKANPGLECGIKTWEHVHGMIARSRSAPADRPFLLSKELNLPLHPTRETIVAVTDWKETETETPPRRHGPCYLGFDLGGSSSMSAAVAYWPKSFRMEVFAAFPDMPDLIERGRADNAQYAEMEKRGELWTYPGRVLDVGLFLADVAARLAGCVIAAVGADRYRRAEAVQALEQARLRWPMHWRGTGASKTADGSFDVRSFQSAVMTGRIRMPRNLVMTSAVAGSEVRRDTAGNPALDRASRRKRIDAVSAAVIAVGLAAAVQQRRRARYLGAA